MNEKKRETSFQVKLKFVITISFTKSFKIAPYDVYVYGRLKTHCSYFHLEFSYSFGTAVVTIGCQLSRFLRIKSQGYTTITSQLWLNLRPYAYRIPNHCSESHELEFKLGPLSLNVVMIDPLQLLVMNAIDHQGNLVLI